MKTEGGHDHGRAPMKEVKLNINLLITENVHFTKCVKY